MIAWSRRLFDSAKKLRSGVAVDSERDKSVDTAQREFHERSSGETAAPAQWNLADSAVEVRP